MPVRVPTSMLKKEMTVDLPTYLPGHNVHYGPMSVVRTCVRDYITRCGIGLNIGPLNA